MRPMRVLAYGRYSSSNQRETSIADQFRLIDERVSREGWPAPVYFSDAEVSAGTPTLLRPGGLALMEEIRRGQAGILIIEALDRCWRDIVDQERTVREIERRGWRIVGASDGYDTRQEDRELNRGVRGILNQQYLRDLAKKTHRGLAGQLARGYHAGGLSYGYRSVVAGVDSKGEPIGHRLEIDEAQAAVVRRIFSQYTEGASCQQIAARLNAENVPGPRGGTWCVSALYGSPAKGSGILNNELYVGRYIWNRSRWTKHPDTGKRERADRPRAEWMIEDRPELRVISDDEWAAVRARMDRRPRPGTRSPRSLFGGLMRCGICGGSMIIVSATAYGCAARKDRGPAVCPGMYVPRKNADVRLLSVIRRDLMNPQAVVELREEIAAVLAERRGGDQAAQIRRRQATLEREIRNVAEAIAQCGYSEALKTKLKTAEAELLTLQRADTDTRPLPSADALVAQYRRLMVDFEGAMQQDVPRARQILEETGISITLRPKGEEVWAEIATSAGRMMLAAGADVASYGCGDALWQETIRLR